MADRKQEQQEQIARAAAEARGEALPEAQAEPAGVEVRIKAASDRQPHYAYEFGKAHGFGADYAFNAENNFTAYLSPEDAEELRARNDPRFTIRGGE